MGSWSFDLIRNRNFLVIRYVPTANDRLCSETGDIVVDDIETCKKAAQELNKSFTERELAQKNWPKGCFLFLSESVYFNQHSTGSSNNRASQICKPKGK